MSYAEQQAIGYDEATRKVRAVLPSRFDRASLDECLRYVETLVPKNTAELLEHKADCDLNMDRYSTWCSCGVDRLRAEAASARAQRLE